VSRIPLLTSAGVSSELCYGRHTRVVQVGGDGKLLMATKIESACLFLKCRLSQRLKEAIKQSQRNIDGINDFHSDAGSDGAWETLMHEEV
jgi:hypothetical protein